MKKYIVLKRILLGFNCFHPNQQTDMFIVPGDIVETDGKDLYVEFSGEPSVMTGKYKSITYVEPWLRTAVEDGYLKEI